MLRARDLQIYNYYFENNDHYYHYFKNNDCYNLYVIVVTTVMFVNCVAGTRTLTLLRVALQTVNQNRYETVSVGHDHITEREIEEERDSSATIRSK